MKYFWFLLAAIFAGVACNAGYQAYQKFDEHPGTRGMTEAGAGLFVVALVSIFAVMAFNKGREKPVAQEMDQETPPANPG